MEHFPQHCADTAGETTPNRGAYRGPSISKVVAHKRAWGGLRARRKDNNNITIHRSCTVRAVLMLRGKAYLPKITRLTVVETEDVVEPGSQSQTWPREGKDVGRTRSMSHLRGSVGRSD